MNNTETDSKLQISEFLLQIKAIKLNVDKPFTWASGWKSPIYCDNRKTLSYPKIRNYIREQFVKVISDEFGTPDVIAGVATGGVAIGALVAQEMGLPFVYVRTSKKDHGLTNQIEGVIQSGQSVVVIEDLVSTGTSSLNAVEALKAEGCKVIGMTSIFNYGFDQAKDAFKKAKVKLVSLTNYDCLIQQAVNSNYIHDNDLVTLKKWREDPANWKK